MIFGSKSSFQTQVNTIRGVRGGKEYFLVEVMTDDVKRVDYSERCFKEEVTL